jgi:site-specific recombinase XerD
MSRFDSPLRGSLTTGEWSLERYRAHLELRGLQPRTINGTLWLVEKFTAWADELRLTPQRLTLALVEDYRRHRMQRVNAKGRRDAPRSVNLHLDSLRVYLSWLGLPPAMLAVLAPIRAPRRLPKATPTHEEVMAMLVAIPGTKPLHTRDRAMLEVFYSSALRREELIQLQLDDLDLDGGLVRVENGKGGHGRIIPAGRHAVDWLRKWLDVRARLVRDDTHRRVFVSKSGGVLDGPSVRDVVRRWAKAAGITKSLSPHALRRACATEMVKNGAPIAFVKEILGHEDFSSMDAYVRLVVGDLKKALAAHHPREKGPE